jgi:DNA-directed RNA polymerase subunit L
MATAAFPGATSSAIASTVPKVTREGNTFFIQNEDHTLGGVLVEVLQHDPRVAFSGYKVKDNVLTLTIETMFDATAILSETMTHVVQHVRAIRTAYAAGMDAYVHK